MKMAASQGGGEAASALHAHLYCSGPQWNPGVLPHQQQQQHGHSARSLDRALEDAVCSGALNLSGRKLREYPRMSYDLTDTTQADLSKNRFSEIPPEVCLFAPLESLNLYHNCVKGIPKAIINLQMLTYLNISRNLLSALPKYLFDLPLKVLVVSNNKLMSVPEEIGKSTQLMQLDISCNEIQTLPSQMGNLQSLRELNVRRNCLHSLPEGLAHLPLTILDFSCNSITEIPPAFRNLRHLQLLVLDNNPLQSPPAQICLKGKVHIFKYLHMQSGRGEKKPDSLELASLSKRSLPPPLTGSTEDFYPSKNHGPDSGIGSESGDKRLSAAEPSDDDTVSLHSQVSETPRDLTRAEGYTLSAKHNSNRESSDFADLMVEEELALTEGNTHHNTSYVACLKELEKVLQSEDEDLNEELGSEKEQVSDDEEKVEDLEITDLSSMGDELLEQEHHHRFLSHSENGTYSRRRPPPGAFRSASLDEGTIRKDFTGQDGVDSADFSTAVFGLKPRSAFSRGSCQEYGPGFTIRRKLEHIREEMEQIKLLRQNLESRLKVLLPEDVGTALLDGVVLCHLANHIRPRSVASIHVPSPAVPKLSMAKCRRNVENFLDACKKLGVPQDKICLPHHILEERGLVRVGVTVQALLDLPALRPTQLSAV
ncbi:leucine-rich repeat and calponin homology domain-containing protein 2-like [Brienomyrus brachyistius]|uniref:leucine-rich repeat and calponin homology domain-containing protein 2-like n=1 Tax=Brienomyrus brachyistius TaxID=42636 RepID=UPI0020B2FC43|nr:leucine-rich repeat and calponin homology domain-containing protein 2-like [Brienomyrus brachyistius]